MLFIISNYGCFPEGGFKTLINLNANENLDSKKLEKSVYLSCFIEEQMFNIKILDEEDNHIIQFTLPNWANRKEKDFTTKINNFKLLIEAMKEAVEKKRLIVYRFFDSFMLTIFYTIIFKEEKISFELHKQLEDKELEKLLIGQFFSDSEPINELACIDYKAELLEYSTNFEDYGDRSIIKIRVKNIGNCTWERNLSSFRCVPEFSTLLCNECPLTEDVIPGDEYEAELEYMKSEPDNYEPPYFTFLHLHILSQNFEPMLILDFNNAFKEEKNKNSLIKGENQKIQKKFNMEPENIINEENEISSFNLGKRNKNNNIFNNVKVNISFNVENNNNIISVHVNNNKVNFNIDKNKINIENKKNKLYVEGKGNETNQLTLKRKEFSQNFNQNRFKLF